MKKSKFIPYLMVSPYLIHFIVFVAFPVVFSFILMFHHWNIISPMEFVGLKNFYRLVQDDLFFTSIFNTFIFLTIHIPLQIVVALFLAELLNQ
ncbi:MAG: sugar ABC transporter permease, partial [Bacteroidales bacterium]|nr:sugar ABC transporter permease [Bacteroidales bacterium]